MKLEYVELVVIWCNTSAFTFIGSSIGSGNEIRQYLSLATGVDSNGRQKLAISYREENGFDQTPWQQGMLCTC